MFCGLAIRWQYILDVADHAEPNPSSDLVPARGFEPRTFGLKDRCSNQAELRRHGIDCGLRTAIGAPPIPSQSILAGRKA